jgi:hypothetical protein
LVSVTVELVVDQAVDVEVVNAVTGTGTVEATVILDEVVSVAVVIVVPVAWMIKSTVVVLVSTPPAIHAGWNSRPSRLDCASVKTIVSAECIQIPYG